MTLDLLHNKIIKETLTEGFERSVSNNLVPKLYTLYGASLEGIQLYEDYINDNFIKDGYWYYPLTVIIGGVYAVLWIKWDISDSGSFKDGNPYAFIGDGEIDFLLADDIPLAFKNSIEEKSNFFEGGYVKLNVITDAPDPKILAGKYSQTFVDEMNRQISSAISRACGVRGLEDSTIELDIVFAPNTYMEHTSENVTYRRLLISAKGCSARDFWIKWTRKNSSVAYSVNDNVTSNDIVFELGEDVPQKIREKEYRFLVYGNSDKYRIAMGRKNVTEWRELIKRAVKRGELLKTTSELEEDTHVAEVSDKLSEILEKCGVSIPASTSSDIRVDAEVANEALRLAVLGSGDSEKENYVPEIPSADAETESVETLSKNEAAASEYIEQIVIENTEIEDAEVIAQPEFEDKLDALLESLPDEENAEFDFGAPPPDIFELAEANEEELSFEDILGEFIPKASVEENDVSEQIPEIEEVDISNIAESESVVFDKNKTDEDLVFDEPEEEALPELEIEIYEESNSGDAEKTEEPASREPDVEYDERVEVLNEYEEAKANAELNASRYNEEILRLQKEVISLKRQLEVEKTSKEAVEARLEIALIEKNTAENNLSSECEARKEVEQKLQFALTAKENAESQTELELLSAQELRAQIEKQKFAIDQVKKLVEEETAARNNAEAELDILRVQMESLRADNENLKEIARVSEEACRAAEAKCKHHERELLNQIELAEKERIREKNLVAEAARQAKEENEQRFAELREAEIARITEEARIEALRRAEEERQKLQDELRFSSTDDTDNVYPNATIDREKELMERAKEARRRMEEKARLNAEAKANTWGDYADTTAPVYENNVVSETAVAEVINTDENSEASVVDTPEVVSTPAPVVNYTYTSYIVRIMFRNSADPNVTARIHEMISYALAEFGKDHVYMKVKASMPDNYTVILNFVKFPKEEFDLLVDLIKYLGKSDLGIYKVVLD